MDQQSLVDGLPTHLRPFVAQQDYAAYTPRDHAVWRYIMHQLEARLASTAHPVYREGLSKTGISLEQIPSIDDMNRALDKLGWAAVVVDGFIPPAIFMEFQARRILVIALDMRSHQHILYTPAPDIVHESAGHAPFIVDIDYAEFLQRFGELGMRAIATRQDHEVYEAIRALSIQKEDPASTPEQIKAAEVALNQRLAEQGELSEAALLSRLHWWTVEYGLVGELDDYRIFGAGLLSSLGESVNCLDDARVRKRPLTVDAIQTAYDITSEQPQLFVTKSCQHLSQVLEEFAAGMAWSIGGAQGLRRAIASESVCTAQYSSGLQVSGQFSRLLCDAVGNPTYLATSGPTQLARAERELPAHGTDYHAQGFGSPIGKLMQLPRCLSEYSVDELKEAGIVRGQRCRLEFLSGIVVQGRLDRIHRENHRNLLLSFSDCRVSAADGECLFDPAWGQYDMAVGARIAHVWGGAADRERYALYADATPARRQPPEPSADEAVLYQIYQAVREARAGGSVSDADLSTWHQRIPATFGNDWLLRLELLELCADPVLQAQLREELSSLRDTDPDTRRLIDYGLTAPAAPCRSSAAAE